MRNSRSEKIILNAHSPYGECTVVANSELSGKRGTSKCEGGEGGNSRKFHGVLC